MSTYTTITRHPNTKEYAFAEYIDDYFAPHSYGVKFPNDPVVYPIEMVKKAQLKEFWADDVLAALKEYNTQNRDSGVDILVFLKLLNKEYKARWARDPLGGEGAIEHAGVMFPNEGVS